MADFQFLTNLNLNGNQLLNAKFQQLATAPSSPSEGLFYEDTTLHAFGAYINSEWVYFATKAELVAALALKQDNISFETNSPLSFGTGEDAAQLKIALSTSIAATGSAVDTKVATEKAVRDLHDGIPAETMTLTNKTFDAQGTGNSLSNVTAANFDSDGLALGASETQANAVLPSQAKVAEMIDAAQMEAVIYRGAWTITPETTDLSGLESFLTINKGDFFVVNGTGPATVGGVEFNPGDHLIANKKITAASGLVIGNFDKIDNTEAADLVRLNATQTLTNKTIDADDNTISDLTLSNLKSGVLVTDLSSAQSDDTTIASAKAVQTAINTASPHVDDVTIEAYKAQVGDAYDTLRVKDGGISIEKMDSDALSLGTSESQANAVLPSVAKVGELITAERSETATLTNKTIDADDNTISDLETDNFKSGVVVTSIGPATGTGAATDAELPTAKAVRTLVDSVVDSGVHVYSEDNAALTPSGGQVTWTVTHGLDRGMLVQVEVFEKATGESVGVNVTRTSTTVVLSWNASATVAAETYTVVVIG